MSGSSEFLRGTRDDDDLPPPGGLVKAYFGPSDLHRELCPNAHSYKEMRTFSDHTSACLACADIVFRTILEEEGERTPQLFFFQMSGGMSRDFFQETENLGQEQHQGLFPGIVGHSMSRRFLYAAVVFYLRSTEKAVGSCSYGILHEFISRATLARGEKEKKILKNFFEVP